MTLPIEPEQLKKFGLTEEQAKQLNTIIQEQPPALAWKKISSHILKPSMPFALHLFLFSSLFSKWRTHPEAAPAWIPDQETMTNSNISLFMKELNLQSVQELQEWSVDHYKEFWQRVIQKLNIKFKKPYTEICHLKHDTEFPKWLVNAKWNIIDSCFDAPSSSIAVTYLDNKNQIQKLSYGELHLRVNQVANSLIKQGITSGDAIAIIMPMTVEAVVIYLGIIAMGGIVVSIADSFSSEEISTRLKITNTTAIFTQDYILRGTKQIPLYEKILAANPPKIIVLPSTEKIIISLRKGDIEWKNFLSPNTSFTTLARDSMDPCNILFSSGTTAVPKAIPWTHSTIIKAASDAYFHQNIQPHDVLAWPTNLGWMMGPWLIFAALLNKATIAIYADTPNERPFGEFIQNADVTMLGIVPTLVSAWRHSHVMENLDWHKIKVFSSTGECSNSEDMLYLMSLAGYRPIIEYCGGTEIGGAYVTSTVIEPNYLSVFSTAALGTRFLLLNDKGEPDHLGEVALVPPALGLSTQLINADHHQIYFDHMPKSPDGKLLRRHGDLLEQLPNKTYRVLGRADDTMNLSGIKISAAEIERAITGVEGIVESAAIPATPPASGPTQLIIFAVTDQLLEKNKIMYAMQKKINHHLNPLFKIHDVIFVTELPKTASNKIMRRVLKNQYQTTH
ncbi:MAG: AMP-binding protein [Gammaproteobacteria bacterium]|nr:AMP-binding protein [Gammaproteobacteria bacterium]